VLRPRRAGGYTEWWEGQRKRRNGEGGGTDRLEGLSPGKPFLVGFGCRTVVAM